MKGKEERDVLQLAKLLLAQVDSSNLVSHIVRLDVLPLLAQPLLDVPLLHLGPPQARLKHIRIGLLPPPDLEVEVWSHRRQLHSRDPRSRRQKTDGGGSEVDGRELRGLGGGDGGVFGGSREGTGGDGDDVLETGEVDVFEGVAVEEVEEHRFQLNKGRVRVEEGGGKVHERAVTGGGFGSLEGDQRVFHDQWERT
jgi:hypothetical protein